MNILSNSPAAVNNFISNPNQTQAETTGTTDASALATLNGHVAASGSQASREEIMGYAAAASETLDTQINNHFADMEASKLEAANLTEDQKTLALAQKLLNGTASANDIKTAKAAGMLPKDSQLEPGQAAESVSVTLKSDSNNSTTFTDPAQVSSEIDSIQTKLSEVNSGSQMGLLQLQMLINQKQELMTITTNLMKAIHDSMMNVSRNIQ